MRFLVGFFSLEWLRVFDFIAPLLIRLLLAPVFWVSGTQRLGLFSGPDVLWYNPLTWINTEVLQASAAQLNIPLIGGLGSEMLTLLVGSFEVLGAVLLILGFAVRWIVPFLIAIVLYLGYQAVSEGGIVEQLKSFAMEHGYVTMEHSQFEIFVTYLILLLTLFFMGAGRWFSLDWFIYRKFMRGIERREAGKLENTDPFEIDATDEAGLSSRT